MRVVFGLALLAAPLLADVAAVPLVKAVRGHARIVEAEVVASGDDSVELRVVATLKGASAAARLTVRDARPKGVPPLTGRIPLPKGRRAVFFLHAGDVMRIHPAQVDPATDAATVRAVAGLLAAPDAERGRGLLASGDAQALVQVAPDLPRAPWTAVFLGASLDVPHLRWPACAAIAKCGYREPVAKLLRLVTEERSGPAALALAELGVKDAAGPIERALNDPRGMDGRPAALRALGTLAGERALPALAAALASTGPTGGRTGWSEQERFAAAEALGGLPTPRAVPPLAAALKTADSDRLRIELARALARHGPDAKEALPLLRELAAGNDRRGVADEARRAITAIDR